MKQKIKVFISYAREDKRIAEKIYNDLNIIEVVVPWIDFKDIQPGQNWPKIIHKTIRESDFFIALLSKNSITKKGYVQKELKIALNQLDEIPDSNIYIIPVRLDNCNITEQTLINIHWVDLFLSYESGIEKIRTTLTSNFEAEIINQKSKHSEISFNTNKNKKKSINSKQSSSKFFSKTNFKLLNLFIFIFIIAFSIIIFNYYDLEVIFSNYYNYRINTLVSRLKNNYIDQLSKQDSTPTIFNSDISNCNIECEERINLVQDINQWETIGNSYSFNNLVDHIYIKFGDTIIENSNNKKYLTEFHEKSIAYLRYLSDKSSKKWSNTHIENIKQFNEAKKKYNSFLDIFHKLEFSFDSLSNLIKQQKVITDIYKKNITSIPTSLMILVETNFVLFSSQHSRYEIDSILVEKVKKHILFTLSKDISKDITTEFEKIFKNVLLPNSIKFTKKGVIENYDSEPFSFYINEKYYLLLKYKFYPIIENSNYSSNVDLNSKQINKLEYIFYHHIKKSTIDAIKQKVNNYQISSTIDIEYEKIVNDNKTYKLLRKKATNRYMLSLNKVNTDISKLIKTINKTLDDIKNTYNNMATTYLIDNNITTNYLIDIFKLKEKFISLQNTNSLVLNEIYYIQKDLKNILHKIQFELKKSLEMAGYNLNKNISKKRIVFVKHTSKTLGTYDSAEEVAKRLINNSVLSICQSSLNESFHEIASVEKGILIKLKSSKFYEKGVPIRYITYPPILSHTSKNLIKLSFLLAVEVEYTKVK